jgi:hypothetical protein
MFTSLKRSLEADEADWAPLGRELRAAKHVWWVPGCITREGWGIETRPFVLFGRAEARALGIPAADALLFSDTGRSLWEDFNRAYGGADDEELRGNLVLFREWFGRGIAAPLVELALADRSATIEVELTEVVPVRVGWREPLRSTIRERLKDENPWATAEVLDAWEAVAFRIETSYFGARGRESAFSDEEFLALFAPCTPLELIDGGLQDLDASLDGVILLPHMQVIRADIVERVHPRRILQIGTNDVPLGYEGRSAKRATHWTGATLLTRSW